ncbi:Gfo/Idh/MocA family oxidoreductase [Paenibacillus sp.]|uniref:Gfo/Idh/MocA family protein n=1 Tax=Paenibacillus sp. TaxID=58172 RepID=UPI002D5C4D58|nr:Gfo/Idh/MocA family oxidoreductase [Paenibacillus sp.]HZG86335.1 Gfo/Idh/MocA family oxidoreductase [Paenibacillus sp.]
MSLNIAVIGTGWFGKKHAEMLAQMEDVRIAGFVGTSKAKAEAAAQPFSGANGYDDAEELLDRERPDAVYVTVPPMAHGDLELSLIERGIPFLVEKPLAATAETPARILKRLRERPVVHSVGYHLRYLDSVVELKKRLDGCAVGMVTGGWMGGMPGVYWWRNQEMSGGQFVEQTTHLADLLRYTAGEVREVYAAFGNRLLHETVEGFTASDVGAVTLTMESGAVASLSNTCLLPNGAARVEMVYYTDQGILDWKRERLETTGGGWTNVFRDARDPYRLENEAFLHAVRTGDASRIRSDYEDAWRTHLVTIAANESARTGRPVRIADVEAAALA